MAIATHLIREELFDLSDLLNHLNEMEANCIERADGIKIARGKFRIKDQNGDHIGVVSYYADDSEWIFTPGTKP